MLWKMTFIIGKLTIEVVDDPYAIDKVEFYIDGLHRCTLDRPNEEGIYSWTLNDRLLFGHIIKIKSYGSGGPVAEDSRMIFVLNPFPNLQ